MCRLIEANVVTNFAQMEAGIANFIQTSSMVVLIGMLLGLAISLAAFGFHLWKGRAQEGQVAP